MPQTPWRQYAQSRLALLTFLQFFTTVLQSFYKSFAVCQVSDGPDSLECLCAPANEIALVGGVQAAHSELACFGRGCCMGGVFLREGFIPREFRNSKVGQIKIG
jgi:hypothetical protein